MQCKYLLTYTFSDIWKNAKEAFNQETDEVEKYKSQETHWMGSLRLSHILRQGMKDCSFEEKIRIVYGFEQILPQIAYL